jgi:hypothetical protein
MGDLGTKDWADQLVRHAIVWTAVAGLILLAIFTTQGLVIVENKKAAVLVRKTGDPLPSGEILATSDATKGMQLDLLPEGWHWRNPYTWDWEYVDQV